MTMNEMHDAIAEAIYDGICDGEGRLTPAYLIMHLAKHGLKIVESEAPAREAGLREVLRELHEAVFDLRKHFDKPITDENVLKWRRLNDAQAAARAALSQQQETGEQPPREIGKITWHASEEDGGPDVGIELRLGGDAVLWHGEISRLRWEGLTEESQKALGNSASGRWLILYLGKNLPPVVLGRAVSDADADPVEVMQALARVLRLPAPPAEGGRE